MSFELDEKPSKRQKIESSWSAEHASLALARKLQEEEDVIYVSSVSSSQVTTPSTSSTSSASLSGARLGVNLIDPNPDIRALFLRFDQDHFGGALGGVEVKWSKRMTLCAGVCSYEGGGGLCSIRLSEPLLKFRPTADLIDTLIHEMIHAFLFVTQNDRDRSAHGPNFQKHMKRINQSAGTNITVYHTFHDEVDAHRQHWWKCDGPCVRRSPFFGLVKRSMNRAPGPSDFWHAEHQKSCGGTFHKIKEPPNYKKKVKKAKEKEEEGRKQTCQRRSNHKESREASTV
eukprot:925306_1